MWGDNMSVEFKDYSIKVKKFMDTVGMEVLDEVGGEMKSQVIKNTAVDTGQLKGSWTYVVQQSDDTQTVSVGSPLENAIWEELGTGEYALNGDGRKGGWAYVDKHGVRQFTYGKHPRRALYHAYTSLKNGMIKRIQDAFKGGTS